jgi:hypothetical protein
MPVRAALAGLGCLRHRQRPLNAALIDVFREIDPELTLVGRTHPSLIAQAGQKGDPGLVSARNLANVG